MPPFYEALKNQDFAYILEVKKRLRPSKGVDQRTNFEPLEIAKQYEQADAHADLRIERTRILFRA
ncbi:hypothetical protein [Dubosiella newyorkensis]|uniref:hypothetical protein n=1 Tax=Dubosiella newyorkensis TaxID=1862672 RepID=UPI003F6634C0